MQKKTEIKIEKGIYKIFMFTFAVMVGWDLKFHAYMLATLEFLFATLACEAIEFRAIKIAKMEEKE